MGQVIDEYYQQEIIDIFTSGQSQIACLFFLYN